MEYGPKSSGPCNCEYVPNFCLSRNCWIITSHVTLEKSWRCQGSTTSNGLHFDSVHKRQQVPLRYQSIRCTWSNRTFQWPSIHCFDIILTTFMPSTNVLLLLIHCKLILINKEFLPIWCTISRSACSCLPDASRAGPFLLRIAQKYTLNPSFTFKMTNFSV